MSQHISHIADAEFESLVATTEEPVLVDFWAEWCGPCKAIAPTLDDIATSYAGRVKVVKVNVDHSPSSSRKYNIRSIPTLMLFKGGKVQATHIGMANKSQISQLIDKNI